MTDRRAKIAALLDSPNEGEREAARRALGRMPNGSHDGANLLAKAERVLTNGRDHLLASGAHGNQLLQKHLRISPADAKTLMKAVEAKFRGEPARISQGN